MCLPTCVNWAETCSRTIFMNIDDDLVYFVPQKYNPASHTIIEAHPDVHAHMCQLGWDMKPGVKILFGRWQDVVEQLEQYDGIFFGK